MIMDYCLRKILYYTYKYTVTVTMEEKRIESLPQAGVVPLGVGCSSGEVRNKSV